VHGHQLRISRGLAADRRALSAGVSITECVECCAVEPADARGSEFGGAARGFWGCRVVQAADGLPACLRSGEHDRLAIVPCSHDRIFRRPCQTDKRQRGYPDVENRRAARVNNADGTIMTYKRNSSGIYWGRITEHYSLINARTSPDGEKPTE
jgi:hypothetical protein